MPAADGADKYKGGDGIDTLDFSASSKAITLTLSDGTASFGSDTITTIENIFGGSNADRLTGNSLANELRGNGGNDRLEGRGGNDLLDGGEGTDTLDGGDGNDHLLGGAENNSLKGGDDNDLLEGGDGNDMFDGGDDEDTLNGGAGNDVLKGGDGDDVLNAGDGDDILTGGVGIDQFVFNGVGEGIDTITDFKVSGASQDQLVLSAQMFVTDPGDDAFDLIGSGFLRAVAGGGSTQVQVDVDGGGNSFVTLAVLEGNITNGVLADHAFIDHNAIL